MENVIFILFFDDKNTKVGRNVSPSYFLSEYLS